MSRSLGPHNNGSLSLAAIISLTMICVGSFYVYSTNKRTQQAVNAAFNERAREIGQSSNLSNLAVLRSLLSVSKTPDNVAYEPALYAGNYLDQKTWTFIPNERFQLQNITTEANKVTVRSFSPGEATIAAVVPIFKDGQSQSHLFNDHETLEIMKLNSDRDTPYYISSIDVKARRLVSLDANSNVKDKNIVTFGRINLPPPPKPHGIILEIKGENDTSFNDNFGSLKEPLKAGKYTLRMTAKGVVHHGEISINGEKDVVGIDKNTGEITNTNQNIRSTTVVGQTKYFDLTGGSAEVDPHVKREGCTLEIANQLAPGTLPGALDVVAKLIGVDGKESTDATVRRTLIIGKVPALAKEGAPVCQNSCPAEAFENVYGNDQKFAAALDRALVPGQSGNDTFESEKTMEINNHKGRGIICSNYELVAQQVKLKTGKTPSELLRTNPALYASATLEAVPLKQYVAYMAPECKREVVGARDGCGCFASNTTIQMHDGSTKLASEIRAGDKVWNPKTQKSQLIKRVIAGPERWPLLEVRSGGKSVVVTGEHPFLTKDGLKPAYRLTDKDILIDGSEENSVLAVVPQIRKDGEADPEVWNFELVGGPEADEHYVLANGVMTGDLYLQIKINGRNPSAERTTVSEQ